MSNLVIPAPKADNNTNSKEVIKNFLSEEYIA
jgi:hypothetical protein